MLTQNYEILPEKEKFHQSVVRTFRTNPLILIGTITILTLALLAILAPVIAPNDPYEQHLDMRRLEPFTNPQFPFGTDEIGRCLLSRIIYGGRISMGIGFLTSMLSALIGIPLGLIAGYSTKWFGEIISRGIDIALSTPEILLALALSSILGRSLTIVMIAISLVWWAYYARIVRGQVLQIKEADYVTAARTIGISNFRILWRHIFPNSINQVLVILSLNMASAILIEAGLSFLGLGTQPPTPSWGTMLSVGRNFLSSSPWLATFPGIAIMITVLGFNLLGDGLRDLLDPSLRK